MTKKFSIQPLSPLKRADALAQPAPSLPRESLLPESLPTEHAEPSPESTPTPESLPRESRPRRSRPAGSLPRESTGEGYWQLPNWVSDVFLPRLGSYEQLVMFRLFRLTLGFNRTECVCSYETLADRTRLSKNSVIRTVKRLVDAGYLETRMVRAAAIGGHTLEYRLTPESLPPESKLLKSTPRESRPGESRPPAEPMTVLKEHGEHAPVAAAPADVYSIRVVAARLFEAHRDDPGFSHDRLRALVRDALIGQGRQSDPDAIEEAIRGMAS